MPKTCKCGANTYRINAYYPTESETICGDCNNSVDLCTCKPIPEPSSITLDHTPKGLQ